MKKDGNDDEVDYLFAHIPKAMTEEERYKQELGEEPYRWASFYNKYYEYIQNEPVVRMEFFLAGCLFTAILCGIFA